MRALAIAAVAAMSTNLTPFTGSTASLIARRKTTELLMIRMFNRVLFNRAAKPFRYESRLLIFVN